MAVTIGVVGLVGSAATGIMGGISNKNAAKSAGEAQQRYLQQGMDFQKDVYEDTTANMTPWISTGQQALDSLAQFSGLPGAGGTRGSGALAAYKQFQETPYYTFPLAQQMATMDRSAAAKGMSLSEGQLQSLGKSAGGYAASNFGSYISALQNLSGLGATSSANLGTAGNQAAQNVSNVSGQQATSAGNSIMGQNTGTQQMLGGINNLFQGLTGMAGSGAFGNSTGSVYGNLTNSFSGVSPYLGGYGKYYNQPGLSSPSDANALMGFGPSWPTFDQNTANVKAFGQT